MNQFLKPKTKIIDEYINRCTSVIDNKDETNADLLETEIVSVFENDIDNITNGLDNYLGIGNDRKINFLRDVELLKKKLELYKANILTSYNNSTTNNKIPKINVNNNVNSTSSAVNTISINFEQTIKSVLEELENVDMKENTDLELIKNDVQELQKFLKSNNEIKAYTKLTKIVKYIADKAIDGGITLLPYLGTIASFLANH